MVVVLTKAEWNALSRLTTKIDDATKRRRSGATAILVHPTAATAYKRRTVGRSPTGTRTSSARSTRLTTSCS